MADIWIYILLSENFKGEKKWSLFPEANKRKICNGLVWSDLGYHPIGEEGSILLTAKAEEFMRLSQQFCIWHFIYYIMFEPKLCKMQCYSGEKLILTMKMLHFQGDEIHHGLKCDIMKA